MAKELKIVAVLSEVSKLDLDGDIILPGAFDADIESGKNLNMLFMHRRGQIIGQWSKLRMDGTLLKADGVLYTGDDGYDLARMGAKLINTGQMKGISIGFRAKQWTSVSEPDKGRWYGWDIAKLELREASLVDAPANTSAEIIETKRKYDEKGKEEDGAGATRDFVLHKFLAGPIEVVEEKETDSEEMVRELRKLHDMVRV